MYYAKRNKSEKDKYHMISLIYGIQDTKQINKREEKNNIKPEQETNHKRLLNTEEKLRVAGRVLGLGKG